MYKDSGIKRSKCFPQICGLRFREIDFRDGKNLFSTLERPEPGEGEVLVRIKAAGVNPVDAAVARGMLKDFIPAEFPVIPGWDLAGVVEQQGHAAKRFKEGDEVYAYARRPVIQSRLCKRARCG